MPAAKTATAKKKKDEEPSSVFSKITAFIKEELTTATSNGTTTNGKADNGDKKNSSAQKTSGKKSVGGGKVDTAGKPPAAPKPSSSGPAKKSRAKKQNSLQLSESWVVVEDPSEAKKQAPSKARKPVPEPKAEAKPAAPKPAAAKPAAAPAAKPAPKSELAQDPVSSILSQVASLKANNRKKFFAALAEQYTEIGKLSKPAEVPEKTPAKKEPEPKPAKPAATGTEDAQATLDRLVSSLSAASVVAPNPNVVSVAVMSCLGHQALAKYTIDTQVAVPGVLPGRDSLLVARKSPVRQKSVVLLQEVNSRLRGNLFSAWSKSHHIVYGNSSCTKGGNLVAVNLTDFEIIDDGVISHDDILSHAKTADKTPGYWDSQYEVPLALCKHHKTGRLVLFATFHIPGKTEARDACEDMNRDVLALLIRVVTHSDFLNKGKKCSDALLFFAGDGNFQYIRSLTELRKSYNLEVETLEDAMGVYCGVWDNRPKVQEVVPPGKAGCGAVSGSGLAYEYFAFNDHRGTLATWKFNKQ